MKKINKLMKQYEKMNEKLDKIDKRIARYEKQHDVFDPSYNRQYKLSVKTKIDALLQNTVYCTGVWAVLFGILTPILGSIIILPLLISFGIIMGLFDIFILLPNVTESVYERNTIRLLCSKYNKLIEKAKEQGLLPKELEDIEQALNILHTEIEKGKSALKQVAVQNEKINETSAEEKKVATKKEETKNAKKTETKSEDKKSSTKSSKEEITTENNSTSAKEIVEKEDKNEIDDNNSLEL